ncbi:hypothetical protein ACFX11_038751 [Malus domestica]
MTPAEFNVIFSTSRWCPPPPPQRHFLEHQVLLMPQLHLICLLQKLHPSLIQLHNNFTFQKFSPISIYLTQFTGLLFTLKLRAYYLRDAPVAHFPPTRVNTFRLLPFLTFVRVREVATTRPRSLSFLFRGSEPSSLALSTSPSAASDIKTHNLRRVQIDDRRLRLPNPYFRLRSLSTRGQGNSTGFDC